MFCSVPGNKFNVLVVDLRLHVFSHVGLVAHPPRQVQVLVLGVEVDFDRNFSGNFEHTCTLQTFMAVLVSSGEQFFPHKSSYYHFPYIFILM